MDYYTFIEILANTKFSHNSPFLQEDFNYVYEGYEITGKAREALALWRVVGPKRFREDIQTIGEEDVFEIVDEK